MNKVRLEVSATIGTLPLANPSLNLFDQELIEDLSRAVHQARQHPMRALLVHLRDRVIAYESIEHCA